MPLSFFTVPLSMFALAFGFAVITDTQTVHIDRVSIPDSVAKSTGYTPEVVINRLADEMHEIAKQAQSRAEARGIELLGEKGPLAVLADYLKVTPLIRVAQDSFGMIPFSFSGEVVASGKTLELALRGTDPDRKSHFIEVQTPADQMPKLIHDAAYETMRAIDPYILAAYQFKKDFKTRDFSQTLEIIHRELATPGSKNAKWMYNLWGMVLYQQADRAGAIEKFQASLAADPEFASPLLNWGVVLARQGNNQAAIDKFQQAVTIKGASAATVAAAYSEWGFSLALLGQHDEAFTKFQQSTIADPGFVDVYSSWAEVLSALGRTGEAAQMTARSLKMAASEAIYTENLIGAVQHLPATATVAN